jgi:hypothetical protein
MVAYFENTKTGKRYTVLAFDKAAGTVRLKGPHGEFTEKFDKDRFMAMGYALKQGDPA